MDEIISKLKAIRERAREVPRVLKAVVNDQNQLQAAVDGVLQRAEGIEKDVGQAQQLV